MERLLKWILYDSIIILRDLNGGGLALASTNTPPLSTYLAADLGNSSEIHYPPSQGDFFLSLRSLKSFLDDKSSIIEKLEKQLVQAV